MLYNQSQTIDQNVKINNNSLLPVASIVLAVVAALASTPHAAFADCKTYFVAPNGSDSNPGTIDKPFNRLYTAGQKLLPCDTLYVRGGVYNQFSVWFDKSGTAKAPITIKAYQSEKPILNGTGLTIPRYYPFITLAGNYINLSGIEISNGDVGVWMKGNNNIASNMVIHDILGMGIRVSGDYNTAENNTIYRAAMSNYKGADPQWGYGIGSLLGYNTSATAKGMIIRGNTVHDVWGEGIHTFQSEGALVENNTAYDNWARNYYITATYNLIFRNNLAYNTPNNYVGRQSEGLTFAEEHPLSQVSSNNVVINNMFYNANVNAYSWTLIAGTGLTNTLIANNTIVNGMLKTGPNSKASVIKNNIIYRNDGGAVSSVPTKDGLAFSNNVWSSVPVANAQGTGDVTGNPQLAIANAVTRGYPIKADFELATTGSTAIGKGASIAAVTAGYLVTGTTPINSGAYPINSPFIYVASN